MVTSRPPKSATGGALVDATGHLIGVLGSEFKGDRVARQTSPGAATAVNWYRFTIDYSARERQRLAQPVTLGIDNFNLLTPQVTRTKLAGSFGLGGQRGILIDGVRPGSPAAKAGLRGARQLLKYHGKWVQADGSWVGVGGDIMLALDGTPTYNPEDVDEFLRHATPGSVVAVRVLRLRTNALRDVPEGLPLRPQRWLLRHYWRPVTLKVTLGPPMTGWWSW
jgi:S1-C subfamily serine protease